MILARLKKIGTPDRRFFVLTNFGIALFARSLLFNQWKNTSRVSLMFKRFNFNDIEHVYIKGLISTIMCIKIKLNPEDKDLIDCGWGGIETKIRFDKSFEKIINSKIVPLVRNIINGVVSPDDLEEFDENKFVTKYQKWEIIAGGSETLEVLNENVRKVLEQNISLGEEVLFWIVGKYHQAIVAFEKKLLIIKAKYPDTIFGFESDKITATTIKYEDVTGIEIEDSGPDKCYYIQITTPSYQIRERNWWHRREGKLLAAPNILSIHKLEMERCNPYIEKLRSMVENTKNGKVVSQESKDIASQIEKLKELYDLGALSDEEFRAAKVRVLEIK
jgi:hypothetical protein